LLDEAYWQPGWLKQHDRLMAAMRSLGLDAVREIELSENVDATDRVVYLDAGSELDAHAIVTLAGTDGSLYDRFKALDVQGRVRAKTGSLGGVKALSGYATTNRGDPVAFSILSNNFNLPDKRINETIDSLVGAILDDGKK